MDDQNLLCVADRENGRVQCFDAHNGMFAYDIRSPQIGSTIYDVTYAPVNGMPLINKLINNRIKIEKLNRKSV